MAAPGAKDSNALTLDDVIQAGLSPFEAQAFHRQLKQVLAQVGSSPPAAWRTVCTELLHPNHPHALHRLMYLSIYKDWDSEKSGPPPAWFPSQEQARETNLGRLLEARGKEFLGSTYSNPIESYDAFQKFTAQHPDIYWPLILEQLSLHFYKPPTCIFSRGDMSRPGGDWLPGAVLNAAECCLLPNPRHGKTEGSNAIVWRTEGETPLESMTYAEVRKRVSRIANALDAAGFQKGDAIAIDMPMNTSSVLIYLAIILAGYIVAAIADSFAAPEISTRLRVSKAKAIFTQDYIFRGGRKIPLYSRVVDAESPRAIVLPGQGSSLEAKLRNGDVSWDTFLASVNHLSRPWEYQAVPQPIEAFTSILFSSGTSGDPKAVPYSHLQPLRMGTEAWSHLDVRVGDVFVWPTNLGWMMGPFVIFSCLLNGATIGIYDGSPLHRGFGEFVQDSGARMLGTVPTIVKTWRKTGCMDGLDWSKVRLFSSTGEASNVDDDLWLSARGFYKPVVEACGGTELASAFLHGCLLQTQALATFSTPSLTVSFVILNEQGIPYPEDEPCIGEIALLPSLGASHTLLNADHNAIYYEGMPTYKGIQLRRHGDIFERTVGGFYKSHGRSDDTMNLGGIKTSAVEIERVCNKASEHIVETAAVAVPSLGGGPDELIVFAVTNDSEQRMSAEDLKRLLSKAVQSNLNPLFKVSSVVTMPEFPRTATNKVMRRLLRSQVMQERKLRSRL